MSTTEKKSPGDLWQDYLFLTREMGKCLLRSEFPLFEELLAQREQLQGMIEECRREKGELAGFASEQARRELLTEIRTADEEVHRAFRMHQNARRQHSNAAMAYEGLDNPLLGARMDKQR